MPEVTSFSLLAAIKRRPTTGALDFPRMIFKWCSSCRCQVILLFLYLQVLLQDPSESRRGTSWQWTLSKSCRDAAWLNVPKSLDMSCRNARRSFSTNSYWMSYRSRPRSAQVGYVPNCLAKPNHRFDYLAKVVCGLRTTILPGHRQEQHNVSFGTHEFLLHFRPVVCGFRPTALQAGNRLDDSPANSPWKGPQCLELSSQSGRAAVLLVPQQSGKIREQTCRTSMRKTAWNVHCYTACFERPVYVQGHLVHVSRTQYHFDSQIAFLPGLIASEPREAARTVPNRGGQAAAPQGSVAATPHTRQPQASRSERSRPQARATTVTERGKQPSANRMETLGRRDRVKYAEGAGGLVDTTPGPVTSTQSSCELQPRRQADRSVVATPSSAAPASANCGLVSKLVPLARYGSIRLARLPGLHAHPGCLSRVATAVRSTSAGLLGHGTAPGLKGRAPTLAQVQQAQKVLLIPPFPEPLTVTQHFQELNDLTTWSDTELKDDKAASLFDSLDRLWIVTHREKLTSPLFAENLKTFLLIRGGIAPSSPEAVPVIAHVKALTRMRLRLLEERGPGYGHDKRKGRQVKADLQQTSTSAEATSSASSERRGATVSAQQICKSLVGPGQAGLRRSAPAHAAMKREGPTCAVAWSCQTPGVPLRAGTCHTASLTGPQGCCILCHL